MGKASGESTYDYKNASTKGKTDTTFTPEGQQLLQKFIGNTDTTKTDVATNNNRNILNSLSSGAPATIDAKALMDSIRQSSDAQTQVDIAQGRSKFYNKPEGRNDINLADTVSRNAASRDAKLYEAALGAEQYNAQAKNAYNEANRAQAMAQTPEQQQQALQSQQLLQALQILKGQSNTEDASSWGMQHKLGMEVGIK